MQLAAASFMLAAPSAVRAAESTEWEVKAAFLYNFSKYVGWPKSSFQGPGDPIRICILGDDSFGSLLRDTVQGKEVNGRPLTVRDTPSLEDASRCHIVFLSASQEREVDEALKKLRGHPVLTVSDMDDFAEKGGMIGLMVVHNKVRFEVNAMTGREAGLKLGSQLLKVALEVVGRP